MKVLILLSTWNGITYLPAQLQSLFAQDVDGELSLLIRDDGSSDGTTEYIRSLADPRIRLIEGENLGPRGSFFALLRMAGDEQADFYALCDQDDVWRPDKLRRALALLEGEGPALYASSLDLVSDDLTPIQTYRHPGRRTFASTLVSNFVTGCTCVFNRAFLEQMPFPADPQRVIMHDWWLASVATLGSRIVYDQLSRIAYRQHALNHVGIKTGIVAMYRKVRKAIAEEPAVTRFNHAQQLVESAGNRLTGDQSRTIRAFLAGRASVRRRLGFVLRHRADIGMQSALRFVLFR